MPGEAGPTEAHEAAPFKPRRTTRPHTRPQGVGQNRTHTGPPFSRMEGGGGGRGRLYNWHDVLLFILSLIALFLFQFSD